MAMTMGKSVEGPTQRAIPLSAMSRWAPSGLVPRVVSCMQHCGMTRRGWRSPVTWLVPGIREVTGRRPARPTRECVNSDWDARRRALAAVVGCDGCSSGPVAPRDRLSQHRELRAPARAGLGRAAGGARRLARGADDLGAVGRQHRPGARRGRGSWVSRRSAWRRGRRCRSSSATWLPRSPTARASSPPRSTSHRSSSPSWLSPTAASRSRLCRSSGSPTRSTRARRRSRSARFSRRRASSPTSTRSPRRRAATAR